MTLKDDPLNERTIPQKVLLSTDIGTDIDDAVALYLAMNSDKIDLRGVYVTNGPVTHRARIAKHLLCLGGHNALVAVGAERALRTMQPLYTTGVEEHMAPKQRRQRPEIAEDWLSAMEAQIKELGSVVVASIAPLTNLAILLKEKPEAAAGIKMLYVMGGRENGLEHNFAHDSGAAQSVLASDLDILIMPADICSRFRLDINILTSLNASRAQRYLAHMASLWKLYHDSQNVLTPDLCRSIEQRKYTGIKFIPRNDVEETVEETETVMLHLKMLCVPANFKDHPLYHLEEYKKLTSWARKNRSRDVAEYFLTQMEINGMRDTQVADAFVIYALEHPEGLKIRRVEANCDEQGVMYVRDGNKHRLVVDVDYDHFEEFLKERLSKPPQDQKRRTIERS